MTSDVTQRARTLDRVAQAALLTCALVSVATTALVIAMLARDAWAFFAMVPAREFFLDTRWEPLLEPRAFGVWPLVCGSALVVGGSALLALPAGLASAIYLSELASARARAVLKPVLEVLAGIPTVVFGYFALTFVTPLLKTVAPTIEVFNAASAAIVVAVMILPMISSLCDDAIRELPVNLREAAFALGATRFEVITRVLLPACGPRVGAAVILALSRALGETMAVTLAAGATPRMTLNPLEGIQTMTAYIVQVSMGDTPAGGVEYLTCFAVAAMLFAITFVMNGVAAWIMTPAAQPRRVRG